MGRRKKQAEDTQAEVRAQVMNINTDEDGAEEKADMSYLLDDDPLKTSNPLLGGDEEETTEEQPAETTTEQDTVEQSEEEPQDEEPGTEGVDWEERYKHLERKIGEQGNELGMYRKFFDEFIQRQMVGGQGVTPPPQPEMPSKEDLVEKLLEDPDAVLNEYGQRVASTVTQTLTQQMQQQQMMMEAVRELDRQHPDRQEIVQNPEFREWAEANIPRDLLAIGEYNPSVAGYILTQYKQAKNMKPAKLAMAEEIASKRKAADQAATVGRSSRGSTKPVFTRLEIMNMMMNEPEKYAAMEKEIMQAYAEGRVK